MNTCLFLRDSGYICFKIALAQIRYPKVKSLRKVRKESKPTGRSLKRSHAFYTVTFDITLITSFYRHVSSQVLRLSTPEHALKDTHSEHFLMEVE